MDIHSHAKQSTQSYRNPQDSTSPMESTKNGLGVGTMKVDDGHVHATAQKVKPQSSCKPGPYSSVENSSAMVHRRGYHQQITQKTILKNQKATTNDQQTRSKA